MKRFMSRAGLVVGLLALGLPVAPPWQGYPEVASAVEGDEVYELTWNVRTTDYGVQVDPNQGRAGCGASQCDRPRRRRGA